MFVPQPQYCQEPRPAVLVLACLMGLLEELVLLREEEVVLLREKEEVLLREEGKDVLQEMMKVLVNG